MIKLQQLKTISLRFLGTNFTSYIQGLRFAYLLRKRKSFDPETKILNRFLSKGDIAIDIGANGADWTYNLYKKVTSSGTVLAFEADPYYAKATKLTIKIMNMKNVFLIPFGLSDKCENVPLRIKDSDNLRYTGKSYIDKKANKSDKNISLIQLRTLDSFIEEYHEILKTKLIKCDVEGYELFVFKGAMEVLNKARPIIILEVGNFEKHNYDSNTLYKFFEENNYSAFVLLANNKLSKAGQDFNHENAVSVNRILLPNERMELYEQMLNE